MDASLVHPWSEDGHDLMLFVPLNDSHVCFRSQTLHRLRLFLSSPSFSFRLADNVYEKSRRRLPRICVLVTILRRPPTPR